jgi:phage tail tape-measure protein
MNNGSYPMLPPVAIYEPKDNGSGATKETIKGAMAGAVIGARLGPVGAIAGTVIGGLIGFALSDD